MSRRADHPSSNPVRRVFFWTAAALVLAVGPLAWAQATGSAAHSPAPRPSPKFLTASPDHAEGARVLASFRHVGLAGDHWLQFELRVMPRPGPERKLTGQLFGRGGAGGPISKLISTDTGNTGGSATEILLFRSGANASAWHWNAGQRGVTPRALDDGDLFNPLQETDLTPFDLMMPFLQWPDFVYEGVANVRGRPAHAFLLYPPAPLPAPHGGELVPAAVRVFLDTQFSAMTQAEWLDAAGATLKSVTVLDLKKLGDVWLVKSIDLRNHRTRAKTRLTFTAAALDLALPAGTFAVDAVSSEPPVVPRAKIQRF